MRITRLRTLCRSVLSAWTSPVLSSLGEQVFVMANSRSTLNPAWPECETTGKASRSLALPVSALDPGTGGSGLIAGARERSDPQNRRLAACGRDRHRRRWGTEIQHAGSSRRSQTGFGPMVGFDDFSLVNGSKSAGAESRSVPEDAPVWTVEMHH